MKHLRPSVMVGSEWYKRQDREPAEWNRTRRAVLQRDDFTCVYCGFRALKWMHANHIGAEDDHRLENLETICPACHDTQHIGKCSMDGVLSVIDSSADQADIVRETRQLVRAGVSWPVIEQRIIQRFLTPGGRVYDREESLQFANQMLATISPDEYRSYLPDGLAVIFHEEGPWNGYLERIHRWGGQ